LGILQSIERETTFQQAEKGIVRKTFHPAECVLQLTLALTSREKKI